MLPFLKRKEDQASASGPVDSIKREHDDDFEYDGLEAAMEELGQHLASKNYKLAAECFRSAFEMLESEPHTEGSF